MKSLHVSFYFRADVSSMAHKLNPGLVRWKCVDYFRQTKAVLAKGRPSNPVIPQVSVSDPYHSQAVKGLSSG